MILVNITKIVFYLGLLGLSIYGEIPWWALPLTLLYDNKYWVWWKLPWVKFPPPGPLSAEEVSLQQLLQLNATMTKQNGKVIH